MGKENHPDPHFQQFDSLCLNLTAALDSIDRFRSRFFPPEISGLSKDLLPFRASLEQSRQEIRKMTVLAELSEPLDIIDESIGLVLDTLEAIFTSSTKDFQETVFQVMRSFRKICRIQEKLYPIRLVSPYLNRFFLESAVHDQAERFDPKPQEGFLVGLNYFGSKDKDYARGAMSIYVPEWYDTAIEWPLVVALHGGFGHGRDFIWTCFVKPEAGDSFFCPLPQGTPRGLFSILK